MFGTKNIKEDFPKWEDRVKYLFKLTPDNKVTRNQEIDPAYFMNDVAYGRYLNHKDKIYTYRTIEFSKEVFKSSEILFYLYYGYKPDCIFVKNEKDSPVLEDLEDIPTTKHLKRSERWKSKIQVNYKTITLGHYFSEVDAAKAYDKYVKDNNMLTTTNEELGLFN